MWWLRGKEDDKRRVGKEVGRAVRDKVIEMREKY
jgi:hypothetical protein